MGVSVYPLDLPRFPPLTSHGGGLNVGPPLLRLSVNFGTLPRGLEGQFQAELDVTRTTRPQHRVARIRRDISVTKASADS